MKIEEICDDFLSCLEGKNYSELPSENLRKLTGYKPKTNINKGISEFIKWYKDYHKIK